MRISTLTSGVCGNRIQRQLLAAMLAAGMMMTGACQRAAAPPQTAPSQPTPSESARASGDNTATPPTPAKPEMGSTAQAAPAALAQATDGERLYRQHCAACHGDNGNGQGVAAAYLFPKPRDFRSGKFRLISTTNNVPTPEDLNALLVRGMPGSSMPPWAHLNDADRAALAGEVMRLYRDGMRDQFIKVLKDQEGLSDDEIDAQEVQQFVSRRTTPGELKPLPTIAPPDEAAIARGKELYVKQSCHSCHGNEGKGDGQQKMVDDEGLPTRPRDLTRGIYKGGHDPASLYLRMAVGMPGTPMPSSSQLMPEQIVDMAHYLLSMSDEETRQSAILKRERIVVQSVTQAPNGLDDPIWESVEPVLLRMSPLWWRDNADPGLQVQAVHDGTLIALRLSWHDETSDLHAAESQTFEDGVAVELYRGDAEPFIGMGGPKSPVDVWFWDADRQNPKFAVENAYPRTVVDLYPFNEQAVATAEYDRPGTKLDAQPPISLPALASGNQIVPGGDVTGGSELAADGPGSVTFRLPQSQLVKAHGQWNDNRWTVVMTRPLAVANPGDGVALDGGGRASIAFAVWDGSHRDRDGQKSITIWQDLEFTKP
jgi:DMSO reductase family type II enzyme heme b subunit